MSATVGHAPIRRRARPPDPVRRGPGHDRDREAEPDRATAAIPQLLVFSTIQPVIFVLMFRYVFGGAIASAAAGRRLRRLPDARHLRADGGVRRDRHRDRPRHGHEERADGAVPRPAHGAFGGADRADDRGPHAQRVRGDPDDGGRVPGRVADPHERLRTVAAAACSCCCSASRCRGSSRPSACAWAIPRPRRPPRSRCSRHSCSPRRRSSRGARCRGGFRCSPTISRSRPGERGSGAHARRPHRRYVWQSVAWDVGLLVVFAIISVRLYRKAA